ncbi:MAG: hypothetical protein HY072_06010 [Deltaproteobacteria bacterium]|nr:hypothetical protein [Deltaproteobacteria bacterium]
MHAQPKQQSQPQPQVQASVTTVTKKKKGKRIREKEAEGSQAPERFEADTTVKSKYHYNGQPLEVDTD